MKKVLSLLTAFVLTAFVLTVVSAEGAAAELHGVTMPDSITFEGKTLVLNGIGVRSKTFLGIKVYVAGLYLESRSKDPNRIIAAASVRRLRLQMTHDAPKERLVAELREGIERNCTDLTSLKERLEKFVRGVPALHEGQTLTITYVPGTGTSIVGSGGSEVTVPGKDFADAVLSAWLGKRPLDDELKKHLLGL